MDVFEGWEGYLPKLEANWRTLISPQDTVILAGDTSWAMKLEDTKPTLRLSKTCRVKNGC